jgi:hypothetical protein
MIFELSPIVKESHVALRSLLDNFQKHFRALENLGEPVQHWDSLLLHLLSNKLDTRTKREWEAAAVANKYSKVDDLKNFLTM